MPKFQITKISEIFQDPVVIRKIRHQTINILQNELQSVESKIKQEIAQNLSQKNINLFENSPIKPKDVNYLIQQKNKLQEKLVK
jgi:hypothetical protein